MENTNGAGTRSEIRNCSRVWVCNFHACLLSVYLSVRLSVCLFVHLAVYLSVHLSVCLSVSVISMFMFNRHVENEKRTTLAEITFDKFAQVWLSISIILLLINTKCILSTQ